MKKLYCVICGKFRKFKKHKISYILEKAWVLYIIWIKCKVDEEKLKKNQLRFLKSWLN